MVECPSLPGCISQGKTKDEALANIKDAIQLWIEDAIAHNEPVPADNLEIHVIDTVSSQARQQRKLGSARDLIWIADDFDAPLDEFAGYMP